MTKPNDNRPWYDGITRYHWTILIIASLGWIFDVFEGQIFVATMNEAMGSLLPEHVKSLSEKVQGDYKNYYTQITFAAFLIGGAIGGILFGTLSDRIGRKRAMSYTILMYSAFTCVSAFSHSWWHLAGFRFLVAMGVGGEWAVASALVAEVFPKRACAWSLGIFHASSVLGSYLAIAAGQFIVNNKALQNYLSEASADIPVVNLFDPATVPWRLSFILGAFPALLILWIRRSVREPDRWESARDHEDENHQLGRLRDLFAGPLARNTFVGVSLAAVGMATFWGVFVFGKEIGKQQVVNRYYGTVQQAPAVEEGGKVLESFDKAVAGLSSQSSEAPAPPVSDTLAELREVVANKGFNVASAQFTQAKPDSEPPVFINYTNLSPEQRQTVQSVFKATSEPFNSPVKSWEMLAMFLTTTGGGIGLICFGPLSDRIGRRMTFVVYHLGGFVAAMITTMFLRGVAPVYYFLPIFGFFTMGMHAGYAIYFPELFPTRLRSTGGGVCFNLGRILAAPILFLAGWMNKDWGYGIATTCMILSFLYLLGIPIIAAGRETRDEELPD